MLADIMQSSILNLHHHTLSLICLANIAVCVSAIATAVLLPPVSLPLTSDPWPWPAPCNGIYDNIQVFDIYATYFHWNYQISHISACLHQG